MWGKIWAPASCEWRAAAPGLKALRLPRAPRGQDARHWSQGQKNFIEESCLDCKMHLTTILEKCTDSTILHQPVTKD